MNYFSVGNIKIKSDKYHTNIQDCLDNISIICSIFGICIEVTEHHFENINIERIIQFRIFDINKSIFTFFFVVFNDEFIEVELRYINSLNSVSIISSKKKSVKKILKKAEYLLQRHTTSNGG